MAAVPKKLKFLLFGRGPKFHAMVAIVLEFLGLACLIVGIISAVTEKDVGMWSTEWFLITIALWIWALWSWLTAYVAAKE
jgi:Mn2+/Fe2+ NRAMP family transporter